MTRIYYHKLTVHVITTIESPDEIEHIIDERATSEMRIDAITDPENRRIGPCIAIEDGPVYPMTASTDKSVLARWHDDQDAWLDTWPDRHAFAVRAVTPRR